MGKRFKESASIYVIDRLNQIKIIVLILQVCDCSTCKFFTLKFFINPQLQKIIKYG